MEPPFLGVLCQPVTPRGGERPLGSSLPYPRKDVGRWLCVPLFRAVCLFRSLRGKSTSSPLMSKRGAIRGGRRRGNCRSGKIGLHPGGLWGEKFWRSRQEPDWKEWKGSRQEYPVAALKAGGVHSFFCAEEKEKLGKGNWNSRSRPSVRQKGNFIDTAGPYERIREILPARLLLGI